MTFTPRTYADGENVYGVDMNRIEQGIASVAALGSVYLSVARSSTQVNVASDGFNTYPLDVVVTNTGGGAYNTGTFIYTVPATGLYLCLGGIRLQANEVARSTACAIHTTNTDGAWVLWNQMGGVVRSGLQYTRLTRFTLGDQVRLYIYSEGMPFKCQYNPSSAGEFMTLLKLTD